MIIIIKLKLSEINTMKCSFSIFVIENNRCFVFILMKYEFYYVSRILTHIFKTSSLAASSQPAYHLHLSLRNETQHALVDVLKRIFWREKINIDSTYVY